MYIEGEAERQAVTLAPSLRVALVVAAVLVIYIGVFPQRLIDFTQKAATSPGLKIYNYQQGATKPAEPAAAPPPGRMPERDRDR